MERRLAAILAADVVGYSRLIGADEAGTLTALRALRKDLVEPTLKRHRGRVVKLMGDGLLAEFASVVDAGAELRFLPPYSPDFNPIEMAFSKLKVFLKKIALRTVHDLWDTIAIGIDTFTPTECENYFAAAGYDRE